MLASTEGAHHLVSVSTAVGLLQADDYSESLCVQLRESAFLPLCLEMMLTSGFSPSK